MLPCFGVRTLHLHKRLRGSPRSTCGQCRSPLEATEPEWVRRRGSIRLILVGCVLPDHQLDARVPQSLHLHVEHDVRWVLTCHSTQCCFLLFVGLAPLSVEKGTLLIEVEATRLGALEEGGGVGESLVKVPVQPRFLCRFIFREEHHAIPLYQTLRRTARQGEASLAGQELRW